MTQIKAVASPRRVSRFKESAAADRRRRVRQPVTSRNPCRSHIEAWSHIPRVRIPVPPQRADGFEREARLFNQLGLFSIPP